TETTTERQDNGVCTVASALRRRFGESAPAAESSAEGAAAEATAPHHIVALSTVSAHVPRHGTAAAAAHRTRDNRSMSNGAYVSDPPSPNFPLKQPGTAVIHAGPRQEPRIVSVASRCAE